MLAPSLLGLRSSTNRRHCRMTAPTTLRLVRQAIRARSEQTWIAAPGLVHRHLRCTPSDEAISKKSLGSSRLKDSSYSLRNDLTFSFPCSSILA